ncbi:MAG: 50S ribosomal protein L21 [Candidatus Kerfeldbacteria bacterium CG08_land_8_20_14_0_20_43_14]|uniref:Large ribosomal subunit protein bL21 n=1 Tax=Candidatus Kerfeldbacteria bacterium CG08_land_8_20_14_0_20_43_14 TaxID=2014246 RepID=A0A2H0YPN6_9BACT|nr:MAG: 50S ribosomal protein L21 [Candidatus Kerfeldbacteria bacterium CG08_land_8_20_14_0_20_43_14]
MSKFAVIKTGGKQYLVKEGQTLKVERLPGEEKAKVKFDQVLMVSDDKELKVGQPYISGVAVGAEIIKQGLGKKLYVETYKAKTRKHRKIGHRQLFTEVKVVKI